LDDVNSKYVEFLAAKVAEEDKRRAADEAHKRHVAEAAKKIKFD
jgi:hypothetical protein